MKIFFTVHVYMPEWTFGTEIYTYTMAKAFQDRGHTVRVIACESNMWGDSPEVTATDDDWGGVEVHRLRFNVMATPNPVRYDYHNPYVEQYLLDYYAREEPDLVHVCHAGHLSTAVITSARKLGLPIVATATDFWLICPTSQLLRYDKVLCDGPTSMSRCVRCYAYQRNLGEKYRRLIEKIPAPLWDLGIELLRGPWTAYDWRLRLVRALLQRPAWMASVMNQVDLFFSPSHFLRQKFVENGMDADRMRVSPHGIETEWTSGLAPKSQADHLRFAFIGMLGWHKGVHVAVDAFNQLAEPLDATLVLYGDNTHFADYYQDLEPKIAGNARIEYRGKFPHSSIAQVLSEVDILLMPSIWYENTPTIMYEAFVTGTPVMASNIGGMAELIDLFDGGWTFPVGEADSLARLMQRLIQEPEEVRAAQARIKPVRTIEQHVDDLEAGYAEVLDRYGQARLAGNGSAAGPDLGAVRVWRSQPRPGTQNTT
jgi:glycosyltransferase involved in cell wall biosynthesis